MLDQKNLSDVVILAIGTELTDGRVIDTNSTWFGTELLARGLRNFGTISCTDDPESIHDSLAFALSHARSVIISGGLGPTTDDLTRELVATIAGVPLVESVQAFEKLSALLTARGRTMTEQQRRQAQIPQGASVFLNNHGSAAGFSLEILVGGSRRMIAAMPGVPLELKHMAADHAFPAIEKFLGTSHQKQRKGCMVFGVAEGDIGARIESLKLPAEITVCYRVVFPEIELILVGDELDRYWNRVLDVVGREHITSCTPGEILPEVVGKLLLDKKVTIATAESITAGGLSATLATVPGISESLIGGEIVYSKKAKELLLGAELLTPLVSEETTIALAEAVRIKHGTTLGVGVTGFAGPHDGASNGLLYVAISTLNGTKCHSFQRNNTRAMVQRVAVWSALNFIRTTVVG